MYKTKAQYEQVMGACKQVFEEKNKDYDTAWRILRLPSFTDQIMIKAKRIRTIQEKGQQMGGNVVTELVGIVNYAILALVQIALAKDKRLSIPYDEVVAHYDAIVHKNMLLLTQKNHDYAEAWREMRLASMVDIILMKLLRIKKIEDNKGYTIASEGVSAGYQDIVNYAVFSLIQLSFVS